MINIAYSTISYGSSGSDVKKLQESLNNHGYNLVVDGQFGSKTQAAVRDYQSKNGLAVDGIVGANTWGSLNSKSSSATNNGSATQSPNTNARPEYVKSDEIKAAENALNQWESARPGEYESK